MIFYLKTPQFTNHETGRKLKTRHNSKGPFMPTTKVSFIAGSCKKESGCDNFWHGTIAFDRLCHLLAVLKNCSFYSITFTLLNCLLYFTSLVSKIGHQKTTPQNKWSGNSFIFRKLLDEHCFPCHLYLPLPVLRIHNKVRSTYMKPQSKHDVSTKRENKT